MSDESVVETEGITVRKAFDADGFPVPAVTFRVESDRSEPVGLRITDDIPDNFEIEQIGFHPDYGSEHWTATGEGVVRFERTVDPGEAFTTVYGIRMAEDEEPTPFLESPTVEIDPDAIEESDIDEVVPKETSEVVRELAGGKRETVPGLEEEPAMEDTGEPDEEEPDAVEAGATPSPGESDHAEILDDPETETAESVDEPTGTDVEETATEEPEPVDATEEIGEEPEPVDATEEIGEEPEPVDVPEGEAADTTAPIGEAETAPADRDEPTDLETDDEPVGADPDGTVGEPAVDIEGDTEAEFESIGTALAAEIREDRVSEEDLDAIRAAVRDESPSERVRIEHLQSRVSDLEAYSDALEEFIDDNGAAKELLEDLEDEIDSLASDIDGFDTRLESARTERETLDDRIDSVETEFDDVEDLAEQVRRLRGDLDALDERVDDAESVRFEVESLVETVESIQTNVDEIREEIEEMQEDVGEMGDDVDEMREWRDQLQNVFK
ncbi:MAG: hypothetical protein ACOCY7_04445 [Halodesulfurarchaeum sp.]